MPLLETKGAASAQGFGGAGAGSSGPVNYIEDVFSTYLYTGNGSTQTITNGINLSGKGGAVWIKSRNVARNHLLSCPTGTDSDYLVTNATDAKAYDPSRVSAFTTSGFSVGSSAGTNANAENYVSWTFRKQPKFFDVVTYTGNGATSRDISHNLGSVPGCIIVKSTSAAYNWYVYHRSTGNTQALILNLTAASAGTGAWKNTTPTSTVFTVDNTDEVNGNGQTYVAYLFAHDAGGFGLTGTDNVISCGSYTTDSSGNATINLGYEPQFLLVKRSDSSSNWILMDVMRGQSQTNSNPLYADLSSAEASYSVGYFPPTATGFKCNAGLGTGVQTHIYIAIRRGPMKTPESGTEVFGTRVRTGDNTSAPTITPTTAMVTDMTLTMNRSGGAGGSAGQGAVGGFVDFDRLRGNYRALYTISTNAEPNPGSVGYLFDRQNGVIGNGLDAGQFFNYDTNNPSYSYINYFFRRAPGFFDEVCYKGDNQATRSLSHNLGVPPEIIIVKNRSNAGGYSWTVWYSGMPTNNYLSLNGSSPNTAGFQYIGSTQTAATFSLVSNDPVVNGSSTNTYVDYLFATCAGVSKVGSYTGTGALQTINCGFTGGARFVLIKRTDSTGDWYVYDSARGISASNDPYLLMNSTAAEVTGTNYVDTTSVGFQVTAAAPAGLNANGGSFVFLAIA